MKKLAFILVLFFAAEAFAGTPMLGQRNRLRDAVSCADSVCTGFDPCQNFEQTVEACDPCTEDNSESWDKSGGTISVDDATAPLLRGADQASLAYNVSTAYLTYVLVADYSTMYGHFMYRFGAVPTTSDKSVLRLLNSANAAVAEIRIEQTAATLTIDCGTTATTTDALSIDTDYHIWYRYTKGTGANAVCSVEFTVEATRAPVGSGTKFNSLANGTSATDVDKVQLIHNKSSAGLYDQILGKATAIGTVCD